MEQKLKKNELKKRKRSLLRAFHASQRIKLAVKKGNISLNNENHGKSSKIALKI